MISISFNFLIFLLFISFLNIIILFFIKNLNYLKNISISLTFLTFFISLLLWINFDPFISKFQFLFSMHWIPFFNFSIYFGIDGISLFFIILTTFLIPICLLISFHSIQKNIKEYFICFLFIEFFLLIIFSTLDLFLFYIFFESILIPMFFIIGIWGSRERKIKASYLFFIYTLLGSLLMLLAIIHIYITMGTTNYLYLINMPIEFSLQKIYWLAFFASFAIKVPMIPFHIWLQEAHVEAPTAGSVILAGVLLKLGSYGLLRFSFVLFPKATIFFTPFIYTLSVLAIIYTSLTALRQTDLKRIIAYASVAHMNLILVGMFSLNLQGIEGAILQMLSHGLVSSALFLCIGILYDRYHTRLINYYSGLAHTMPIFVSIFLFYIMANIAVPGTSSFIGELLILIGIFQENSMIAVFSATGMFLGGSYSLWLYNRVCFGNIKNTFLKIFYDLTYMECLIHSLFIFCIFMMGIFPNIFLKFMHISVLNIIIHLFYSL